MLDLAILHQEGHQEDGVIGQGLDNGGPEKWRRVVQGWRKHVATLTL